MFGLGGSGLVSASALLAGGADVVAYDDNADSVAKAKCRRHSDRGFAWRRLVEAQGAGAGAGRAADASSAALERRSWRKRPAYQSSATSSCSAANAAGLRPTHRLSPSPAPTANRRRRRWSRISPHRPAWTRSSAAISAPRSCRSSRRRRRAPSRRAFMSSSARPIRSISPLRSILRSASSSISARTISIVTAPWRITQR